MILKAGFLSCFGLIKFGEERRRGGGRVGSHGLLKRNEIRPSDSLSPYIYCSITLVTRVIIELEPHGRVLSSTVRV